MSSWFSWGKKKETPEQKYKIKLDQLKKLGFSDEKKNLQLLQQYNGNVNLVIQDYKTMAPSSSASPVQPTAKKATKPKPKQEPKPKVEPAPVVQPKPKPEPKVESKPEPKVESKPKPKVEPKMVSKPDRQSMTKSVSPEQKEPNESNTQTPIDDSKEIPKPVISNPKPTVKAVQPIMPDMGAPSTSTSTSSSSTAQKVPKMLFNLRDLPSADVRQLLLNIDEPVIAEIVFSNAINGEQFYHYIVVNPLLKKFNVEFGKEVDYSRMKHGAIDIHNKPQDPSDDLKSNDSVVEEHKTTDIASGGPSHDVLKSNVASLVSSDVRLLILPYCAELAERLYAFSISGADLMSFGYDAAVFASGMKSLSKDIWSKIQTECKLKPQPFDKEKWQKLKEQQESVIKQAERAKQTAKEIEKQIKNKQHSQKQQQPPKGQQVASKKGKPRKPIKVICPMPPPHVAMDKADDSLPPKLKTLKQKQMETLTKLHDIAAIVGFDAKKVSEIKQFAQRDSEKAMAKYLKSNPQSSAFSKSSNTDQLEALEQRQLKLLSTIDRQRRTLQKLAESKGVSLEQLQAVTEKVAHPGECTVEEAAVMDKQLDVLFQSLAKIAESVQVTANKYSVPLVEMKEADKHLPSMYSALEGKQEALIARLEYLNDQARMINPKAVEMNEKILKS